MLFTLNNSDMDRLVFGMKVLLFEKLGQKGTSFGLMIVSVL